MMQILAGLTALFAAYVVYEILTISKAVPNARQAEAAPGSEPPVAPAAGQATVQNLSVSVGEEPVAPTVAEAVVEVPTEAMPTGPAVTAQPPEAVPSTEPSHEATGKTPAETVEHLRNPATGEIAPIPNHYRFAKKWIKEALVTEGLLERIYKPGELSTPSVNRRTREALEQLKRLAKYQA